MTDRACAVGLNAQLLSRDVGYRSAGVSRYIHALLTHLPAADPGLRYTAFGVWEPNAYPGWRLRRPVWHTDSPPKRILWEQLAQPWAARRERLDLLHAPVNVGPLLSPCPQIVTLHDLSFYLYPEMFSPAKRLYQQRLSRHSLRHAAGIIAVSESTRQDAVRLLGLPQDDITVVRNGVGAEMRPRRGDPALDALRKRYSLPERFVLSLSTLEPRKNLTLLVEAFADLAARHQVDHALVIAGGQGWFYETIYAAVDRLSLRDRVIFPGYVPEHDKSLWYSAADLFVYPSLYEGFGLPPLEAMACGTPVIVANTSSLPEVVGDAGVYVDPYDAEGLAGAMAALLRDPERRHTLAIAGLAQAARFSWATTAKGTAQVYRRILGEGHGSHA